MTQQGSAPLGVDDVQVGGAYEEVRAERRHRVAEMKSARRVRLSESLALVFENRETIRSTLEEALRTERIDDPERVAAEIEAFNAVVPAEGELKAMLFLEVADPADLGAAALRLEGVDDTVFVEIAGTRVRGVPEAVSPPGETAPAHHLRFPLDPDQRNAILAGSAVAAGSDHPNIAVTVQLDEDQRRAIAEDL